MTPKGLLSKYVISERRNSLKEKNTSRREEGREKKPCGEIVGLIEWYASTESGSSLVVGGFDCNGSRRGSEWLPERAAVLSGRCLERLTEGKCSLRDNDEALDGLLERSLPKMNVRRLVGRNSSEDPPMSKSAHGRRNDCERKF